MIGSRLFCRPADLRCTGGNGGEAMGSRSLPTGSARSSTADQKAKLTFAILASDMDCRKETDYWPDRGKRVTQAKLVHPIKYEENLYDHFS